MCHRSGSRNSHGPYFNVGLALTKSGDYAGAIAPLQKALPIQPANEGARRALVAAFIGLERFREATREIAQLLARETSRMPGLLELAAQTFMRQRRYAEAVLVLRRRLDLAAQSTLANCGLRHRPCSRRRQPYA